MTQQIKMFDELEPNPGSKSSLRRDKWYEDLYPDLDFILIPIVCALAKFNNWGKVPRSKLARDNMLLRVFKTENPKNLFQIHQYIELESNFIKVDSRKRLKKGNHLLASEFEDLILKGASIFFSNKSTSVGSQNVREMLPACDPPLCFSKLARFILNGQHDIDWYKDNRLHFQKLFPHFPESLICDLFAATSIRTDVKSNVTKMIKALHQYYENKVHQIEIGERGKKKTIDSHFKDFLDATIYQLNNLKNGKSFGTGNPGSARKIKDFSKAMQGVWNSVVTDIWLTRAFNTDVLYGKGARNLTRSPTSKQYDAIEWYVQTLAKIAWIKPSEISAMIWSGIRSEYTKEQSRYTSFIDQMFSHGLFEAQYGPLVPTENGIMFFEKS